MDSIVVIPTYKRPQLLKLLIEDLLQQTLLPASLIVVDGDPLSGAVIQELSLLESKHPIIYVASNHANLAYQRYLGWCAAAELNAAVLIYFDDDLRIYQNDVLAWLTSPLAVRNGNVVGIGCHIQFRKSSPDRTYRASSSWLIRLLGSSVRLKLKPGELTPTGHRIGLADKGEAYNEVDWLRGGTMAYRMSAMSRKTFSEDLFAMYEARIGRAEDTFLSRRVGAGGKLLYTFRAVVDHPHADTPKAYPFEAYKYAYAATYSRRFLNDHYRVYAAPTASDRWALVKSYVGNTLLAWMEVARKPTKTNFALARGTTLGAFHGLTRPATAKRLTPDVDWWGDAEKALSGAITVRHGELTPDS